MQPRIGTLSEKKLVGKKIRMSFVENKTYQLWSGFMPRRKEIPTIIGNNLYSLEVYVPGYFDDFNPAREFEKWAAVEVPDFENVPAEMETLVVPTGLYAVFIHKGLGSEAEKTYTHIFRTWLPSSDFLLDNRPHFAVMGEKYKKDDPSSEEEVWIPVTSKV